MMIATGNTDPDSCPESYSLIHLTFQQTNGSWSDHTVSSQVSQQELLRTQLLNFRLSEHSRWQTFMLHSGSVVNPFLPL